MAGNYDARQEANVSNVFFSLMAKLGAIRLKNQFLLTSRFFGRDSAGYLNSNSSISSTTLVSIVPRISFVGSSLLFQFRIHRNGYRQLDGRDISDAQKYPFRVVLAPFGLTAMIAGPSPSQIDYLHPQPTLWSSIFGISPELLSSPTSNSLPDYVSVELEDGCTLSFPTGLVLVPFDNIGSNDKSDSHCDLKAYLSNSLNWQWKHEVLTMFENTKLQQSGSNDSIDFWRYTDPYYRIFDLSLGDGSSVDTTIKSAELLEAKPVLQKLPVAQAAQTVVSKPIVSTIIPTIGAPAQSQSTSSPIRAGTDLDLTVHMGNGRNGSADFSGLELDDVGDDDWGFFQAKPATAAPAVSSTSTTTAVGGTVVSGVGSALNEASPAVSLPACSPAAVTPGLTTILSPIPFTPNYGNTSITSAAIAVQPTPDPTTPGVFAVSDELEPTIQTAMEHSDASPLNASLSSSTLPQPSHELHQHGAPFNVQSILIPSDESNSRIEKEDLLPDCWRSLDLDFSLVWDRPSTTTTTATTTTATATRHHREPKYGAGGKYVYQKGRKRAAAASSSSSGARKHMRMDDSDSDESSDGSESSSGSDCGSQCSSDAIKLHSKHPNKNGSAQSGTAMTEEGEEEEEEVLEDGEVEHPVGRSATRVPKQEPKAEEVRAMKIVPKNEAEAVLALQIMVDSMTVGRGSIWMDSWEHFVTSPQDSDLPLRPALENRLFNFLGSTLSNMFGGSCSNPHSSAVSSGGNSSVADQTSMRGPLTIEQLFDFSELERGTSKYGKFQLKKKKRPDPIMELVRMPNLIVQHNNIPISINPSSLRFWEKLSLAPVCGTKDVEYVVVCPHGNKGFFHSLKRWCAELSSIWDFCNFGSLLPLSEYRNADEEGFCPVRVTRASQGDSADSVRISSYSDAIDHLATDISKILLNRISTFKSSTTNIAIFLLNPFPHQKDSNSELHVLASHLLMTISRFSEVPLPLVLQSIVPVVIPISFALPRLTDTVGLLEVKEFAFGLFSRCKNTATSSVAEASTAAAAAASKSIYPKQVPSKQLPISSSMTENISLALSNHCYGFSQHPYILAKHFQRSGGGGGAASGLLLNRPLGDGSPQITCLSDPDRIMHIVYKVSKCGKRVGVCWSDSIGELIDSCGLTVPVGDGQWFLKVLAEVWERSLLLLGLKRCGGGGGGGAAATKGFISWRFVVGVVMDGGGVPLAELQGILCPGIVCCFLKCLTVPPFFF
ncbi:hypothetical protein BDR26DRAFT_726716 [Obelidium mucronatum]|nr:hypothetical protein BDR26DRAFT_726716 [Obelidium mucronatum]